MVLIWWMFDSSFSVVSLPCVCVCSASHSRPLFNCWFSHIWCTQLRMCARTCGFLLGGRGYLGKHADADTAVNVRFSQKTLGSETWFLKEAKTKHCYILKSLTTYLWKKRVYFIKIVVAYVDLENLCGFWKQPAQSAASTPFQRNF